MSDKEKGNAFADFLGHKYIRLTTFYRNGKGVPTPVEFAEGNGKLYVSTRAKSWKVKRIRNNPNATIEPCTIRGKVKGSKMNVVVHILSQKKETIAIEALKRKYDSLFRRLVTRLAFWRKQGQRVYLEISPA